MRHLLRLARSHSHTYGESRRCETCGLPRLLARVIR